MSKFHNKYLLLNGGISGPFMGKAKSFQREAFNSLDIFPIRLFSWNRLPGFEFLAFLFRRGSATPPF
jgi:hypothetical protein